MGLYAVPPVELIADSVLCFSTLLKKPAHIEVKHNLLYWIKKFTSDVQVSARLWQPTVLLGQQPWMEQPKSTRPHLQILN